MTDLERAVHAVINDCMGAREGEEASDHPDKKDQPGMREDARDVPRGDEDARAQDRADGQEPCVPGPESTNERGGGGLRLRHLGHWTWILFWTGHRV